MQIYFIYGQKFLYNNVRGFKSGLWCMIMIMVASIFLCRHQKWSQIKLTLQEGAGEPAEGAERAGARQGRAERGAEGVCGRGRRPAALAADGGQPLQGALRGVRRVLRGERQDRRRQHILRVSGE